MDSTVKLADKPNGLTTYLEVLYAPTRAFDTLARTPMWGWACLAGIALTFAMLVIMLPEQTKLAQIAQAKALATMSADQAAAARQTMAQMAGVTKGLIIISAFVIPWFWWLISAVMFAIGAAVSGGTPKFSSAWVAAVNVTAVAFVGGLVNSIIVAIGGPDKIAGTMDLQAIPSLGMLVSGNVKLAAFLSTFSLTYIWYYIVAVIALERMLAMKRPAAVMTVLLIALVSGGLAALSAR